MPLTLKSCSREKGVSRKRKRELPGEESIYPKCLQKNLAAIGDSQPFILICPKSSVRVTKYTITGLHQKCVPFQLFPLSLSLSLFVRTDLKQDAK